MWPGLQKFGLEYCDLPAMIGNVADFLWTLALNIDGRDNGFFLVFIVLTVIVSVAYFYVQVFSMIWFVFWRKTEDRVLDLVMFSLGGSSLMGVMKLFYLHLHRNQLKETVKAYLACDALIARDSRMYQNLLKTLRVVKKRAMFFWVMLMTNGFLYVVQPVILPGKHLIEDEQILFGLEPMFESPNYEIGQTLVGMSVFLTCYAPANITALLIIFTGYVEAYTLALSNELLLLWSDAQGEYEELEDAQIVNSLKEREKEMNIFIKSKLQIIIAGHAKTLELVKLTENMFSNAIAMEFGLLGVCLIAELLGGLENTYMQVPFALVQVAMDCFTGQRLTEASIVFRNSLYACQWEKFDAANMKTVLFVLVNSKTVILSAGGVTQLGYTSLMAVFKSIYSAYTALRSTMN